MKKSLSILLALIMLLGCFSMVASAANREGEWVKVGYDIVTGDIMQFEFTNTECTCPVNDHTARNCCVFCPNLDIGLLTSCATDSYKEGADKVGFDGTVCCEECTGIWPCYCGCECCKKDLEDQDVTDNDNTLGEIITDEDKDNFVKGFQSILKVISDAFDKFFDAIFAFLRIDGVLGGNN